MGTAFNQLHGPPILGPAFDLSAERCARSVRDLSTMTRAELEAFLVATARASASVVPERARRPKPPKVRRTWRPSWR
jgi:hypothetical protein